MNGTVQPTNLCGTIITNKFHLVVSEPSPLTSTTICILALLVSPFLLESVPSAISCAVGLSRYDMTLVVSISTISMAASGRARSLYTEELLEPWNSNYLNQRGTTAARTSLSHQAPIS